ncbi:MAG: hypothetical protein R2865_05675 [Deinococcales bacterium]
MFVGEKLFAEAERKLRQLFLAGSAWILIKLAGKLILIDRNAHV